MKTDIKSLNIIELADFLEQIGEKKFRAKQIFKWLHFPVRSFEEMSDISKSLRMKLSEICLLTSPEILQKQVSKIDGTAKYLWKLHDGNTVESVLMKYEHGYTVCVSSQVGCRMGCTFCASAVGGLVRNLAPSEILDQVLFIASDMNIRISNIVLMGTGEPLDNYDNVIKFLKLVNDENGVNIGMRHISLSTCGVADKILELAKEKLQITLSISLHSPDNETRSKIMPINRAFNIEKLIQTCKQYNKITGRRISYEYTMIKGVSDRPFQAKKLAELLAHTGSHINLIPLNDVTESGLCASDKKDVLTFQKILTQNNLTATVRRRLGPDIDAACGQLRRRTIEEGDK